MASVEVATTKVIRLTLDEDEARYLRDILQNYLPLGDEDESAYSEMYRGKIFKALKEAKI